MYEKKQSKIIPKSNVNIIKILSIISKSLNEQCIRIYINGIYIRIFFMC